MIGRLWRWWLSGLTDIVAGWIADMHAPHDIEGVPLCMVCNELWPCTDLMDVAEMAAKVRARAL